MFARNPDHDRPDSLFSPIRAASADPRVRGASRADGIDRPPGGLAGSGEGFAGRGTAGALERLLQGHAVPLQGGRMDVRLLGPLEVRASDGPPLPLGGGRQRAVLAVLLLSANHVVARERLIRDLWGEDPPESAIGTLQAYVSRLRKLLPQGALLTSPPGYVLVVDPGSFDLLLFESIVAEARNAETEPASQLLRQALALWRGP